MPDFRIRNELLNVVLSSLVTPIKQKASFSNSDLAASKTSTEVHRCAVLRCQCTKPRSRSLHFRSYCVYGSCHAYVNMLTHAISTLLPPCTSAPSATPLVAHDYALAVYKHWIRFKHRRYLLATLLSLGMLTSCYSFRHGGANAQTIYLMTAGQWLAAHPTRLSPQQITSPPHSKHSSFTSLFYGWHTKAINKIIQFNHTPAFSQPTPKE